jgi:hypothetical protein
LREGLLVFVDLPVDVLGELLKDCVIASQQVCWKQRADEHGEGQTCREEAGLRPLDR